MRIVDINGDIKALDEGPVTCEACGGDGRVPEVNRFSVDTGTKWQRSFEETVTTGCDECQGTGVVQRDET